MPAKTSTPLSIVVIGGGIGGLAASILLSQSGHSVIVLERKGDSFETRSTGGIALFHNSTRIWDAMGLKHQLADIADAGDVITNLRYSTGEVTARIPKKHAHSMVHRADALRILYERAVELGVDVQFNVKIVSIHDSADQPFVKLGDGSDIKADLLVGADGIDSLTRRTIMPDITPQLTPCTVMLVSIPRSAMEAHPKAAEIYKGTPFYAFLGPGTSIVAWTMTKREVYHLQFCDYEYGTGSLYFLDDSPSSPYITVLTDTSGFKNRYSEFDSSILHIIDSTQSFTKWKIAELPPLTTNASASSRIVLLGDAAHAIQPFAGQGANMAIEDGAALSAVLSLISSKEEIVDAIKVYDEVRLPRLAGMREIIETNKAMFGLKDGEEQKRRDERIAAAIARGQEWPVDSGVVSKVKGYDVIERMRWTDEYDADGEARKAWEQLCAKKRDHATPNGKL